jgi:hypothetical protein
MSSVKYELGFYIPEDDILHSHRRENLKSYRDISVPHSVQTCAAKSVQRVNPPRFKAYHPPASDAEYKNV